MQRMTRAEQQALETAEKEVQKQEDEERMRDIALEDKKYEGMWYKITNKLIARRKELMKHPAYARLRELQSKVAQEIKDVIIYEGAARYIVQEIRKKPAEERVKSSKLECLAEELANELFAFEHAYREDAIVKKLNRQRRITEERSRRSHQEENQIKFHRGEDFSPFLSSLYKPPGSSDKSELVTKKNAAEVKKRF